MYASFESVSRGAFMCDMRCTAQIEYSWDSHDGLGIEGASVRNSLSLGDRGGTTSQCRVKQHHISLCVARGLFNSVSCSQAYGCERLRSF